MGSFFMSAGTAEPLGASLKAGEVDHPKQEIV